MPSENTAPSNSLVFAPSAPSLGDIYRENIRNGLTVVFEEFDRRFLEWNQQRVKAEVVDKQQPPPIGGGPLLTPQARSSSAASAPIAAIRYRVNPNGTLVWPPISRFGELINVLPMYDQFRFLVTMPHGLESAILRFSFQLADATNYVPSEPPYYSVIGGLGARERAQYQGGIIGAAPFQSRVEPAWPNIVEGGTRIVWAGDARLIINSSASHGDVYHTPVPISQLLLEII